MPFAQFPSFSVGGSDTSTPIPQKAKNTYVKKNVGEDQNQYVRYASAISNNNLDFLSTLEAENGLWTIDRVGVTGDIGFCQISPYYHKDITSDFKFLTDPWWQLDKCWELYSGGTKFYGSDHRESVKDHFIIQ